LPIYGKVKHAFVYGLIDFSRAMTHDERMYTEPSRFMPERFIQEDGTLSDDLGQQQFGFGRRYFR
jgi:cytochrome P450